MRGHGVSGTRSDIGYVGQLEDDLADFVAVLRQSQPTAPITLVWKVVMIGLARLKVCTLRSSKPSRSTVTKTVASLNGIITRKRAVSPGSTCLVVTTPEKGARTTV